MPSGDARAPLRGARGRDRRGPLKEILPRLGFLAQVGLGYLTLDRRADTLSGGEAQRIRLAAQLGSNLRGVCYILDEPTIGLHPRDNGMLLDTLERCARAATPCSSSSTTRPRSGAPISWSTSARRRRPRRALVAVAPPAALAANPASITGRYLGAPRAGSARPAPRRPAAARRARRARAQPARHRRRDPARRVDVRHRRLRVGQVDARARRPLPGDPARARSPRRPRRRASRRSRARSGSRERGRGRPDADRADAALDARSYVGFLDDVRRLFAQLPESRLRGWSAGRFSFNVSGGRCDACAGQGRLRMEMSFLPDVYVDCDACGGRRYTEETLAVRYAGRTIAGRARHDVEEAAEFFAPHPTVRRSLAVLCDIGLGI
jgi:excinuclease ABC subunit A